MTREIPNCKYNDDKIRGVLNKGTVELISKNKKSRAERMVRECQTEEEILLDNFTDSLYNRARGGAGEMENPVVDLSNNNDDSADFELDPAATAAPNDVETNVGDEVKLAAVTVDDELPEG